MARTAHKRAVLSEKTTLRSPVLAIKGGVKGEQKSFVFPVKFIVTNVVPICIDIGLPAELKSDAGLHSLTLERNCEPVACMSFCSCSPAKIGEKWRNIHGCTTG